MATANKLDEVQVITRGDHDPDRRNQSNQEKRAARNSRVHFGDFEDVDTSLFPGLENQPILVEPVKEELNKTVCAYFGILQEAHRYEVKFGIPFEEIKTYVTARDEKLQVIQQPSSSRLVKISWEEYEGIGLILQLLMELEIQNGLSFEDIFVISSESIQDQPNRTIHIRVAAQVLGKGQGTPTLKYGIKCLGHLPSVSPPGSPERSDDPVQKNASPKKSH